MMISSTVRRLRGVDGVVLAQRVTVPVLREQDAAQVRMPLEYHAEHVVALALHPVGATEDAGEGRAARGARLQPRPQRHRHRRVEVLEPRHDLEALLLPVHRGQPVEIAAAERLLDEPGHLRPTIERHRHVELGPGPRGSDAKPVLDLRRRGRGRERGHAGSAAAGRVPVFWKCATCSCSFNRPYISESGVGGQPGTYTSTGTTRSTPLTTW